MLRNNPQKRKNKMSIVISDDLIINVGKLTINDVIESVALQQTALSHIINAEGEKKQKAMQLPHVTNKQLLAINDSVAATINSITQLETLLVQKIEIVDCGCD